MIASLAEHAGTSESLLRELFLETAKLRASFLGSAVLNKCQYFGWWEEHAREMRKVEQYLSNAYIVEHFDAIKAHHDAVRDMQLKASAKIGELFDAPHVKVHQGTEAGRGHSYDRERLDVV